MAEYSWLSPFPEGASGGSEQVITASGASWTAGPRIMSILPTSLHSGIDEMPQNVTLSVNEPCSHGSHREPLCLKSQNLPMTGSGHLQSHSRERGSGQSLECLLVKGLEHNSE